MPGTAFVISVAVGCANRICLRIIRYAHELSVCSAQSMRAHPTGWNDEKVVGWVSEAQPTIMSKII